MTFTMEPVGWVRAERQSPEADYWGETTVRIELAESASTSSRTRRSSTCSIA
jgi:hypothetical protein